MADVVPQVVNEALSKPEPLGECRRAVIQHLDVFVLLPAKVQNFDGIDTWNCGIARIPDGNHRSRNLQGVHLLRQGEAVGTGPFNDNLVALLVEKVGALHMELAVYRGPSIYHFCICESD